MLTRRPQGGGEGVRGGQAELGLRVGQLLVGSPHGVVGGHQGVHGLGLELLNALRRGGAGDGGGVFLLTTPPQDPPAPCSCHSPSCK